MGLNWHVNSNAKANIVIEGVPETPLSAAKARILPGRIRPANEMEAIKNQYITDALFNRHKIA